MSIPVRPALLCRSGYAKASQAGLCASIRALPADPLQVKGSLFNEIVVKLKAGSQGQVVRSYSRCGVVFACPSLGKFILKELLDS